MSPARGPTVRIVCVNDIYTLENLPRLLNLVRHYARTDPADLFLVTLAGDFIGPSMLSSLDKGRGMIECLNTIGVTHVSFGNHEDDIDVDELRQRIQEFRGTWLNTNVPGFVPKLAEQQLLDVAAPGGRRVRIGLLGVVMDEESVYRRRPFGGSPVAPANPTALQATAQLLSQQGCACVIPLTHQELAADRDLARAQSVPRFPLIIGGHEHDVILEQVEGTWIVKAGADAVYAAVVDLAWPAEAPTGTPDAPAVQVQLAAVADYPEDAPLRTRIESHMRAVYELEVATLVRLPPGQALSSVGARSKQTSLGTLLGSRIRDALGSDGCLLNAGGFRGQRDYRDHFTYGDLKAELPYDNEVAVVVLPGRIVRDAIAASRAYAPHESGGYLQVDDKMSVSEPGQVLTAIGGAPLVADREYRIAMVRNLLTGMDHIAPLVSYASLHPECLPKEGSGREVKVVLVDSFCRELWQQLGPFDAIDTDRDGTLSQSEIAAAVTRVTAEPASQLTVNLLFSAVDTNKDHVISREEAEALGKGERSV